MEPKSEWASILEIFSCSSCSAGTLCSRVWISPSTWRLEGCRAVALRGPRADAPGVVQQPELVVPPRVVLRECVLVEPDPEREQRDELAREAQSAPADERRRMLDLLKRFEEDGLGDSPLLGEDVDADDDDMDDLVERLGGIDVGASLVHRSAPCAHRGRVSRFLSRIQRPRRMTNYGVVSHLPSATSSRAR